MHPNQFNAELEKLRERLPVGDGTAAEYEFEHNIRPRLAATGWEERFRCRQTLSKPQKLVMRDASALLKNKGAIVALVGERGLGKTTLAAHIAIERAEHFWNYYSTMPDDRAGLTPPQGIPVYRKMAALVTRFKPLYADFGSVDTEALIEAKERLCNETLLVIDELHECEEMKAKDRVLTDLVDIRYSRRRDTILISNQAEHEFRTTTNSSVVSRLSEHGQIFVCKWPSFRGATK